MAKKNIYCVEVLTKFVVEAETEEEVYHKSIDYAKEEIINSGTIEKVVLISSLSDLPSDWKEFHLPYDQKNSITIGNHLKIPPRVMGESKTFEKQVGLPHDMALKIFNNMTKKGG